MKTAILTQPLRTNYGGILQNYALQQCLRGMGHEVYTLDDEKIADFSLSKFTKRLVKVMLGKTPVSHLLYEHRYKCDYKEFTKYTRSFVSEHISLYPYKDLHKDLTAKSFDAYIVGSDQVWRPGYNDIENMFLDFTQDWPVKRLAYAASFGVDTWEFTPEQTAKCASLAKRFDSISIRESSGVELCKKNLGVDALHVVDPTMLLTKEDYCKLVDKEKTSACKGDMFIHVLDRTSQKQQVIEAIASHYHLTPFTCNQSANEGDIDAPIEKRIQPPLEQWLRSFMEAKYVVTDSFHGTVFSILFNKPFLVLNNPGRGASRIESLLQMFGLEKCFISETTSLVYPEINYQEVNLKLEQLRNDAKQFLSYHLHTNL